MDMCVESLCLRIPSPASDTGSESTLPDSFSDYDYDLERGLQGLTAAVGDLVAPT